MKATTKQDELPLRTFDFAIRIVKLYQSLDAKPGAARILGKQLLRAGTSIGANVAEGKGAQSEADFLTKMSIALKEARETQYWIDLLIHGEILPAARLDELRQECGELILILTSICRTIKAKRK